MYDDLSSIFHPHALAQLRSRSPADILNAPINALAALGQSQIDTLTARGIHSIADLLAAQERLSLLGVPMEPAALAQLTCLTFYPGHDQGPGCMWSRLFQSAPVHHYVNYPGAPFHTRFGPVFYRGRLDGKARLLVIGQDPSTDEILAQRVFVGRAGQIAQNFLSKLGLTSSYVMFNTYLFGVQSSSLTLEMATDANIMAFRNRLFDRVAQSNPLTAILALGSHADASAWNWPQRGSLPVIHIKHPTAPDGVATNWNAHLTDAQTVIAPDPGGQVDMTPYSTSGEMPTTDIPRRDLPFGLPAWLGTGGATRSQRGSGAAYESRIIWNAPSA